MIGGKAERGGGIEKNERNMETKTIGKFSASVACLGSQHKNVITIIVIIFFMHQTPLGLFRPLEKCDFLPS
jgi:hypothetical protein